MRSRLVAALLAAAALALGSAGAFAAADVPMLTGNDTLTVTDVLVGQGKTGPYALAWNHIGAATLSVSLNGLGLLRGVDYTVDEAAGSVTFTKALAQTDVARATYLRRPGVSQVNAVSLAVPIADALRGPMGSTLGASYLYQRSPDAGDITTQGVTAALQTGGGGKLSGALLLNDRVPGPSGADSPRKLGWALSGDEHAGRLALSGSLMRADAGLVGGKDQGVEAGVESVNLAASYQALQHLTAGATFVRHRDLASGAPETQAVGYSLAFQPGAASMGLAHTTTTTDSGPSPLIEEKTDYTLLYKTRVGVTVGASLSDTNRNSGADDASANYALAYSGRDGLSFAAARLTTSSQTGDTEVGQVTDRFSLKTRLGPRSVATAAHEIIRTDQGATPTTRLDLTTAFLTGVDLQAGYFTTGAATPQTLSQAGFKVTAIPMTQLSGRVGTERKGEVRTDVAGVDATITPGPALSLGGGFTRRTGDAGELDTTTANVTLAAGDAVKLTGEYAENPNDDTGSPVIGQRSKVNLTTKVGSLSVAGGAGRQRDAAGLESALYEAQVDLRFWRRNRLYTGYRLTNSLAPDLRTDDEVYRLGYSREAGPNFSLSLEAQMLLYHENEQLLADRTERRAQASLNARF